MLVFIVSSPPFSPIASGTDAAQETEYTADDPAFAAKQPGKQNPLDACLYQLFFLPPSLSIDSETGAVLVIGYAPEDQSFSAEQPGKQNTLDHQISPIPFSLILALELPLLLFR